MPTLPNLPPLNMADRLARLRMAMRNDNLDGLIVRNTSFHRYLIGPNVSAVLLTVDHRRICAYIRPDVIVASLPSDLDPLVQIRNAGDPSADAVAFFNKHAVIGFEAETMTSDEYARLRDSISDEVQLRKADELLRAVCSKRDLGEVARVNAAAKIVGKSLDSVSKRIQFLSEAEFATEVDRELQNLRARQRLSKREIPQIRTYVAYGANAGDVTHRPTSAHLRAGELAIVSAGAVVDAYWAVESRTLGTTNDPRLSAVHSMVRYLSHWVRQLLRAGRSLDDVTEKTMLLLREAGVVGLAPHVPCFSVGMELADPQFSDEVENIRFACVEPGLYIPGAGGARIGQTEVFTGSPGPAPKPINLEGHDLLADVPPYFSSNFSVDSRDIDRHTEILIGDHFCPWDGGL